MVSFLDESLFLFYNKVMNIYSYFRKADDLLIPGRNRRLFLDCVFILKNANVKKAVYDLEIQTLTNDLMNEEIDLNSYLDAYKSHICLYKSNFLIECSDFFLYVFIFITLLDVLWTHGFQSFDFGIGFLFCMFFQYMSLKGLITYLGSMPDRSKLKFWLVLIGLFGLYMIGGMCRSLFVLFLCPVWAWVLFSGLGFGISLYVVYKWGLF